MAVHEGMIDSYAMIVDSPTAPSTYNKIIYISGTFGGAYLYFARKDSVLPGNTANAEKNFFNVSYYEDHLTFVTEMLRYEKPVYFSYNDQYNTAQIRTNQEPVGEEETV